MSASSEAPQAAANVKEISSSEQLPSWSKRAARLCGLFFLGFIWFIFVTIGLFYVGYFGFTFVNMHIEAAMGLYQEAMPDPFDPWAVAFVTVIAVMLLLLLMVQGLKVTAMLGHLCLLLNGHRSLYYVALLRSSCISVLALLAVIMYLSSCMLVCVGPLLVSWVLSFFSYSFEKKDFHAWMTLGFWVYGILGMALNLFPFIGTPVCWYWKMEMGKIISTTPFSVGLVFFAGAVNTRLNLGSSLLDWWPTCATWTCLGLYMVLAFPFPFKQLPFKEDSEIAWTWYPYEIALCLFLGACASAACILMFFCSILHKTIQGCSLRCEKFSMHLLSLIVRGGCAVLTMASMIKYFDHSTVWASLLLASVGLETLLRLFTLPKRNPRCRRCCRWMGAHRLTCRRCVAAEPSPIMSSATVYGAHEPEQEQEPKPVFAPGDRERVCNYVRSDPCWVAYWFDDFPQFPTKAIAWAKKIFPESWFLDDSYLCECPHGAPPAQKCLYGKRVNHEAFMMTWRQSDVFKKFRRARIRPVEMPEEIEIPFVAQQPAEQLCFELLIMNTFIHCKIIDVKVEASLARCSSAPAVV